MFVPHEAREQQRVFHNDQYEIMGLTGLWVRAGVTKASGEYRTWLHMLREMFACRKKYALPMAGVRTANIRGTDGMTDYREILQGPPMLMAGEKVNSSIRDEYTNHWALVRQLPGCLGEYCQRSGKAVRCLARPGRRDTLVPVCVESLFWEERSRWR